MYYLISVANQEYFDNIKKEISDLHLITRSHFHHLLNHNITINGINELFIMTIHSKSHITYSKLNSTSSPTTQEEFIFCIASVNIFFI